jgi:hypothetical protein
MMTPLITEFASMMNGAALEYRWFDTSGVSSEEAEQLLSNTNMLELLVQPFPFEKCAVVGNDVEGNKYAFFVEKVMAKTEDGSMKECISHKSICSFVGYAGYQPNPPLTINPYGPHSDIANASIDDVRVMLDPTYLAMHPTLRKNQAAMEEAVDVAMTVLAEWLQILDKKSAEVYKPIAQRNHAKRVRQGKKPFYDWHVVTIEPSKPAAPHQGGTHASPRLHEVRGHWVNRNGKRFWRRPHERGDASLGIAFHDYKFKEVSHG